MVAHALWLWLSLGWLLAWLTEALTPSVCELAPCKCARGVLDCDCSTSLIKDITLRPELFDSLSLSSIRLQNCDSLHVAPQALSGLSALQVVSVANISTVTLEERSFSYLGDQPQLLVNISHCHMPEIPSYCFSGQLREVVFQDVRVSRVRPYAFSSMDLAEKLSFTRVQVELLEPQSFKKFSVGQLSFTRTNITTIPRRAFSDVQVLQEVRLEGLRSERIEANAFHIHSSKSFKIVQSTLEYVEGKAFNGFTKGDVSIHETTFSNLEKGAFVGLTVDSRYLQEAGKEDLIFENNTLENFESGSLIFNTSGFEPRIDWLMIKQQCSCDKIDLWTVDLYSSDPSVESTSSPTDALMFCLNPKFTRVKDFQTFHCNVTKSSLFMVILLITGAIVIVLVVVVLGRYYRAKKRGKRYINVPASSSSALKPAEANRGHMLVVPEGKTYRETELHVIIEHAEPIVSTEFVKERPDRNGKL